jgi:hypothetical protein
MKPTVQYLLAILLCAAMTPLPCDATSADSHSKHSRDTVMDSDRSYDAPEEKWERDPIVFSARDRNTIRNYYSGAGSKLVAGPAKRNGYFPRGSEKHLQRNGMLPLGWQKRLEPLPADFEHTLQRLYSGFSRGMIGQDVVIVEDRTHRIMDIIRNVTGRR